MLFQILFSPTIKCNREEQECKRKDYKPRSEPGEEQRVEYPLLSEAKSHLKYAPHPQYDLN